MLDMRGQGCTAYDDVEKGYPTHHVEYLHFLTSSELQSELEYISSFKK